MGLVQWLYEVGYIIYMWIDGIDMVFEVVMVVCDVIKKCFGEEYLLKLLCMYKNKVKNVQEVYECICLIDMMLLFDKLLVIDKDQKVLYDLIWKCIIVSQMELVCMECIMVEIVSVDGDVGLCVNGQVMQFDGFLKVYDQGCDDEEDEDGCCLFLIEQGEVVFKCGVIFEQYFMQVLSCYIEVMLVKCMEELGIGCFLIYVSIVMIIQDCDYVCKEQLCLILEDKGWLVMIFLLKYFLCYVSYDFILSFEGELDDIFLGEWVYCEVLCWFWKDFIVVLEGISELCIIEVFEVIDEVLVLVFYLLCVDGSDFCECLLCYKGWLYLKIVCFGGVFVGCMNYFECCFICFLGNFDVEVVGDSVLGVDNGDEISLKNGCFGFYVQCGEVMVDVLKLLCVLVFKGWELVLVDLEKVLVLFVLL